MVRPKGHKLDKIILDYMKEHRRVTPIEIAKVFGVNKDYVVQRLAVLVEEGKVRKVVRGLYEIVNDDNGKIKGT